MRVCTLTLLHETPRFPREIGPFLGRFVGKRTTAYPLKTARFPGDREALVKLFLRTCLEPSARLVKIQNPYRILEHAVKHREIIRRYEIPADAI